MKVEWSADALADLDRFAEFLHAHFPHLAALLGRDLIERAKLLAANPNLGQPIQGHSDYRQIIVRVLNAPYVMQYRVAEDRIVILRVFHGKEDRIG